MFSDADQHARQDDVLYFQVIFGKKRLYGHTTWSRFASVYLQQPRVNNPVFELLRIDDLRKWRRLHFDIDHFHDSKPPVEEQKQKLKETIAKIRTHIQNCGCPLDKTLPISVINGSRQTETRYKESYHIVFTQVLFHKNNDLMKDFVQQVCTDIDCDSKIYTKNRVFRLAYSPKKTGGDPLVPWDTGNWCEQRAVTQAERQSILKASMISTSDTSGCYIISTANASFPTSRKRVASKIFKINEPLRKRYQIQVESWRSDLNLQKALMLLGCLTSDYVDDYNNWVKTGFIIIGLFRQSPKFSEALFHWISRRSSTKYDKDGCAHKFADLMTSHSEGKYENRAFYNRLWRYAFLCNSTLTRIIDDQPTQRFISTLTTTSQTLRSDSIRVFVLALDVSTVSGQEENDGEKIRALRRFIQQYLPAEYPLLFQIITHNTPTTTTLSIDSAVHVDDDNNSIAAASEHLLSMFSKHRVSELRCRAIMRMFT